MWVAAALAVSSFFYNPHPHRIQVTRRPYALAGWSIVVGRDTFTGAVACSLRARTLRYRADTLIFHLGRDVETTHAVFRIDGGPPRPVSQAFHEDEARGFFPRRGWIDNPAGGDVALPAGYFQGAKKVWIRASPRTLPRYYDVSRFADALAGAKAAGCPADAFQQAASF